MAQAHPEVHQPGSEQGTKPGGEHRGQALVAEFYGRHVSAPEGAKDEQDDNGLEIEMGFGLIGVGHGEKADRRSAFSVRRRRFRGFH
jgi:hypothetical protein